VLASSLRGIKDKMSDRVTLSRSLLSSFADGRVKQYVTHAALSVRKSHRELFMRGDYEAIAAGENVVAFTRRWKDDSVICAVPRLVFDKCHGAFPIGKAWKDEEQMRIPYEGIYENVFTGERHERSGHVLARDLFATFPIALLVRSSNSDKGTP